jgi:hypothetical protein
VAAGWFAPSTRAGLGRGKQSHESRAMLVELSGSSCESRPNMHRFFRFRVFSCAWRSCQACAPGGSARAVNPFLRIPWRSVAYFAKRGRSSAAKDPPMSPDTLNSLLSLCLGFALAGALSSGYQALLQRPAGFGLLQEGAAPRTFAAVPFLVFAAPFIIMRNTLRGRRIERRRFEFVMMATVLAGFWSLMSGTFVVMTLKAIGLLA